MKIESIRIEHHGRVVDGDFYRPEGIDKFPIIIFSHGYNGHKSNFEISAKYFADAGIGAVCYNFCGGSLKDESGFPTTDMTLFTEKEDLIAVMDEVKSWNCFDSENLFLFGGSQGGMVSALTAEEREADVKGLILLFPAFCIADNWNERFKNESDIPDEVDLWGMKLGRKFFETIRDFRIKERVGGFSKKVLIMHGKLDSVVSYDYAVWASQQYPDAVLEIFEQEGHGFSEYGDRRMEAMALYFVHGCMRR